MVVWVWCKVWNRGMWVEQLSWILNSIQVTCAIHLLCLNYISAYIFVRSGTTLLSGNRYLLLSYMSLSGTPYDEKSTITTRKIFFLHTNWWPNFSLRWWKVLIIRSALLNCLSSAFLAGKLVSHWINTVAHGDLFNSSHDNALIASGDMVSTALSDSNDKCCVSLRSRSRSDCFI